MQVRWCAIGCGASIQLKLADTSAQFARHWVLHLRQSASLALFLLRDKLLPLLPSYYGCVRGQQHSYTP